MNWTELDRRYCWHPFTQAQTAATPLTIVRGHGAHLFDETGQAYLDAISSWWVNLHGHAHPAIAAAIAEQATQLEHVMFAGITHPPAIQLAQQLVARLPAPLQYVFYSDNGSTAVEVALKMACQYWRNQGQARHRFLAFEGAYHGDTFGAMAMGKSSGFYTPFADWLFDVDFLPYPASPAVSTSTSAPANATASSNASQLAATDSNRATTTSQQNFDRAAANNNASVEEQEAYSLSRLDHYLAEHAEELVAFIIEPLVQGAAGMRMARPAFLQAALTRVRAHGIPIIFDEVMTGFGRTGTFFAAEQIGITPDLICLSKGLTGGFLPMAATVAQAHIYDAFLDNDVGKALLHGHSYTANPLGCAAALASLRVFDTENTMMRVQALSAAHKIHLNKLSQHQAVINARQCGTIIAFEIRQTTKNGAQKTKQGAAGQWLREYMRRHYVLLRPLGSTVYLVPPYCLSDQQLAAIYDLLHQALNEWLIVSDTASASDFF